MHIRPPAGGLGAGHKGLFDTVNNSLHFQLGLALASCWYYLFISCTTYVFYYLHMLS